MKNSLESAVNELQATQPKYAMLAQNLLSEIYAGRFPVGTVLPSEAELCAQFGISRYTARAGLKLLQDRGYIRSERPIGRRVISDKAQEKRTIRVASVRDLVQLGVGAMQMVTRIEERVTVENGKPEVEGVAGKSWLRVDMLRWAAGSVAAPTQLSEFWIDPMYGRVRSGLVLNKITPAIVMIDAITSTYGVKLGNTRQRISAVNITGVLAKALQVPSGAPGLRIQRWFLSVAGDLVMYADSTFNGREYAHETTLHMQD